MKKNNQFYQVRCMIHDQKRKLDTWRIRNGKLVLLIIFLFPYFTIDVSAQPALRSRDINKEINKANTYYNAGNFLEAINILENTKRQGISKNREIDQLLSRAYINYSYYQLKDNKITLDEGIELTKKAYALDPMRPEASYNIACMYGQKGQVEEGIKWLEKSYLIMIQDEYKYKQLLEAFRNDTDLNKLRLSPEFNNKFPKLALQATEETSAQKPQQSKEQNLRAEQVIFTLDNCRILNGIVRGNVPQEIDLSNDTFSRQIVEHALKFAKDKCPKRESYYIVLCKSNEKYGMWEKGCSVEANYDNEKLIWSKYENNALKKRLEEESVAAGHIRSLPGNSFLFLLGADSKTGVKFWSFSFNRSQKCQGSSGYGDIYGEVPNTISLLDDSIVRSLVIMGSEMLFNNCKKLVEEGRLEWVNVSLIPADYKVEARGGGPGSMLSIIFTPILVKGRVERKELKIISIKNYVTEAEQRKLKLAEEQQQREKERQEILKRQKDFVDKNGVKEFPSIGALSTNPFVYEGKTIGIIAYFKEMLSATQGLFVKSRDIDTMGHIVVSDIPKGLFKSKGMVVLAGKVLGKTEVKLPLLGAVSAPQLKFVGVYFCKDDQCSDIIPTNKK